MTDYFALFAEARRPWLEPEKLKEKYFALSRAAAPNAELNEAFRVLSDPKLRLHHLLTLEGADLTAGRPIPPSVAELFWNTGSLLREIDRWVLRHEASSSTLGRALLSGERDKLKQEFRALEQQLDALYENEIEQLHQVGAEPLPNEIPGLISRHDSLAYLTRLRLQMKEKRLAMMSVD
jgi:curved DNA-binding protein CbpA